MNRRTFRIGKLGYAVIGLLAAALATLSYGQTSPPPPQQAQQPLRNQPQRLSHRSSSNNWSHQ